MIQDYGLRLYNPAIAKFLSVDPLAPDYPWYTPYQFAGNKPIRFIDLDGLEEADFAIYALNQRTKQDIVTEKKIANAIVDGVTMPFRAAATGAHAFGSGVLMIPQYAQGNFSSGAPSYYDYMNWRWNQGGTHQSEQTMNQMSWEAISSGGGAALGGMAGLVLRNFLKSGRRITGGISDLRKIDGDGLYYESAKHIKANSRSIKDAIVTKDGIGAIEKHLSQDLFTSGGKMNKGNQVMIDRLKKIESGQLEMTDTDRYFYTHEFREQELMNGNYSLENYYQQHAQTSKEYGVTAKMENQEVFYTEEAKKVLWE